MPVDAIVRVSFQSNIEANQAANEALVGTVQGNQGARPFTKVGTAAYTCSNAPSQEVGQSISDLGDTLNNYANDIDFVSVSLAHHD